MKRSNEPNEFGINRDFSQFGQWSVRPIAVTGDSAQVRVPIWPGRSVTYPRSLLQDSY